jgi:hypothetical protein
MKWLVTVIVLFFAFGAKAQKVLTPLSDFSRLQVQSFIANEKNTKPTAYYPILFQVDKLDSISDADTKNWTRKEFDRFILRKLRNQHVFEVRTKNFMLNGDVAFNVEYARQLDELGRREYTNARGYHFSGTVGSRLFFQTSYYEIQSILPTYMDSVSIFRGNINTAQLVANGSGRGSVPGFSRWKPFNTSDTSYNFDYGMATGSVGFSLSENSFVQIGTDKQFLGYGYRSILLSDVSAPFSFVRFQFSFLENKLTYTTTYAVLQSLERSPDGNPNKEDLFKRQGGRFSYLHFQPKHWLGIGLFDATTWSWYKNAKPLNALYFSPHAFVYNQKGVVNHLVGLNAHMNPLPFIMTYLQVATNTKNASNVGYQIGAKILDPIPGFTLTLEFNATRAGLYESNNGADSLFATYEVFDNLNTLNYYQHNDQMLGHPIGGDMNELLIRAQYRLRDLFVSGAFNHVQKSIEDFQVNSDYFQFEAGYVLNPRSNMQIVLGNINRMERKQQGNIQETYTYFAFRTNLTNRYFDF